MTTTMAALLRGHARATPEATALVHLGSGRTLTFRQLQRAAARLVDVLAGPLAGLVDLFLNGIRAR